MTRVEVAGMRWRYFGRTWWPNDLYISVVYHFNHVDDWRYPRGRGWYFDFPNRGPFRTRDAAMRAAVKAGKEGT